MKIRFLSFLVAAVLAIAPASFSLAHSSDRLNIEQAPDLLDSMAQTYFKAAKWCDAPPPLKPGQVYLAYRYKAGRCEPVIISVAAPQ